MSSLHKLSRLHKSRRDSNRCNFFAGAAGGFCIPRAQQQRKTVGAATRITWSQPRIASARSSLLFKYTEQALTARASMAVAMNLATPVTHRTIATAQSLRPRHNSLPISFRCCGGGCQRRWACEGVCGWVQNGSTDIRPCVGASGERG